MKFLIWPMLLFLPYMLFAKLTVVKQTSNSVIFEFQMENLTRTEVQDGSEKYIQYLFDDGIFDQKAGFPAIPSWRGRLAVPVGSKITYQISVLESESHTGEDIIPQFYSSLSDIPLSLIRNDSVYSVPYPFPGENIRIGEQYDFRGSNVVSVQINPIQYYPAEHRVEIHKRIQVTIIFKDGQPLTTPKKMSHSELKLLSNKIINADQAALFSHPVSVRFQKIMANYDFSTGQWFRIPIKTEGIYQITGSFLQSQGINLEDVQLDGVHLYNYGGFALPYSVQNSRPADLNEIALEVVDADQDGIMDPGDKILFYGKGMGGWRYDTVSKDWKYEGNPDGSRTLYPYDDTNYYLCTFNNIPGRKVQTIASPQAANPVNRTKFRDYYHFEEDDYNILASGLDWYWLKMTGLKDKKSTTFTLPQNITNDTTGMLIAFKGSSGSIYGVWDNFRYTLKTVLNNQVLFDNLILYRNNSTSRTLQFPNLSALKAGSNELQVEHNGNLDGCEVFLDYFEIILRRPFVAENNQLRFRDQLSNNTPIQYSISGLPSGTNEVWDISDFTNIRKITPLQNGQVVRFQDISAELKAAQYYVFGSGAVKTIAKMEKIENHPNLRDPSRKAEFLIITPDEFYDAAEFLEVWRETQIPNKLETERVKLSEIFDEFSSSVKDATAIRDFIKYVNDSWSDSLKYVLLFGDGHYDYRNIKLVDEPDYIPPFEITNAGQVDSRETDNFYVALGFPGNLNYIDPSLPIARLPFNSLEQIASYREKAEKYAFSYLVDPEKNGWQNWLTFVSDDQYGGAGSDYELSLHLQPTESIIKNYIPPKFNIDKIYLCDYDRIPGGLGRWKPKATEDLLNRINRGTLMINFFGHGDPDTWAHESVLNRSRDLPKFQNIYRLPLWVAATCTWGKYDDPSRPSMSEELIWLQQMGGIGVISASRPVNVTPNVDFVYGLYNSLFNDGSENQLSKLIGEAFFDGLSTPVNYQKYHLYGDPTLKLADPRYQIKIQSIQPDTLKALSTVSVRAEVTNELNSPMTDFNGYAVLHVFDAVDSTSFLEVDPNNTNNQKLWRYVYGGGTIFKGLVTVKDGELAGHFIVPKSIKYKPSRTGRISLYAWSEEQGDAIGSTDTMMFYGTESGINDQDGPDIAVSFKEIPNFFDGDFVPSQPTLQVEVEDVSGINLTGEVGHRIELTVDEGLKKDVTEFFVYETDSYQKGKLEYTMPALSSGTHQLKITCWDNLNNYSERTVTFRTTATSELMVTEIVNYPNPFANDTYFTFQMVSPNGGADVTISVYTVTGRKIQEIKRFAETGFNKFYWNGLDYDGDILANGVYLYKIVVDDGQHRVEKIDKLAVVR
jgi:hypothetical protein